MSLSGCIYINEVSEQGSLLTYWPTNPLTSTMAPLPETTAQAAAEDGGGDTSKALGDAWDYRGRPAARAAAVLAGGRA